MSKVLRLALVILENSEGYFALQLRAAIPGISYPDHWGLFGGHIEDEEEPGQAALREVQEELSCMLDPSKMHYLQNFRRVTGKWHFVFHYSATREFNSAKLTEGQRFEFFRKTDIQHGVIEGKKVVVHHLSALRDYWIENPASFI